MESSPRVPQAPRTAEEVIHLLDRIRRHIEHQFPFRPDRQRICIDEHGTLSHRKFWYIAYGYAERVCFVALDGFVEPFHCSGVQIKEASVVNPDTVLHRMVRPYHRRGWTTYNESGIRS